MGGCQGTLPTQQKAKGFELWSCGEKYRMSTHNHYLQPKSLSWNEIKTKDGEEKDVWAKEDADDKTKTKTKLWGGMGPNGK